MTRDDLKEAIRRLDEIIVKRRQLGGFYPLADEDQYVAETVRELVRHVMDTQNEMARYVTRRVADMEKKGEKK